jgi:hypothetical protein
MALAAMFIPCLFADRTVRADGGQTLRAGIIGLDTSHAPEFAKLINDPKAAADLSGVRVVAAYPAGSDIPASRDRKTKFTADTKALGVEIVDSIPSLLAKVDVVLVESVDGRVHLEQVRPVFAAGKPVFIDKPYAGTLADMLRIADLAEKTKTPWFGASSVRYGLGLLAMRTDPKIGGIVGCTTWSPCHLEPTHPDLYWYGIHGVEALYTAMGPGCESVSRTHTAGVDVAVGVWKDGRVGLFQGLREGKLDYGAVVFGKKQIVATGKLEGYRPLVVEIVKFFKTRRPAVDNAETIEIMAFMEAADESKRRGGTPVKLVDVLTKAREQANAAERKER